ncbi:WD repeat-containing protein 75-like [Ylistrum balloti]|uniref:WD repeat-containing protein 75-like n=1 Tax=Ylistrum balloti TaxID=509963 RepID=UPI0029058484|nr:WD repeat-containing protein 75-like [Ylistrum balloti]
MSASTENVDEKNIVASVRAGANLVHSKPLFSHDSKFLFCCAEALVKVYSTISGECVHDLRGHTSTTTGLVINSQNKLQLLSCSLDQTVIFWDYADCVLLKRIRLQGPLHGIWIRPGHQDHLQVLQKRGKSYDLVHSNLLTSTKDESVTSVTDIPRISSDPRCSAIGCKGKFVAAVNGSTLYIKLKTSKSSKTKKFPYPELTCVACHPVDYCIATGAKSGKIILWWNFLGDPSHVVKTTLHWHALPVLDLAFTTEGAYLLSGGHECVLVKWQYNSEYRNFRPRLGAPLCHVAVSPDNLYYATSHQDNVIHLLTSSFSVAQVYQGLTKSQLSTKQQHFYPAELNFDPRSKALVLNGKPGHLQFYSVHNDTQLYNLDIVCQNYISSENMERPLTVTEVIKAEFNSTGRWLVTVEYWNNGVMTPEMRLKFWQYNTETQSYTLNTAVEVPHDKVIECLRFRPDGTINEDPMVVTTSLDGKFKIWSNMDDTNIYRANTRWSCESVGFYHGQPAGVCAFTADGSLLGVAFDTNITLWDPDNNILKETLNSQQGQIQFMEFGKKSCSHYLVTTTKYNLTVWDLITCAVTWTARIKSTHLVADPLSDVMVLFEENKSLYVFKPSNPNYLYHHKNLGHRVVGGVFIPQQQKSSINDKGQLSWQTESQLYWMTSEQDLMTLTLEEDEPSQTKPTPLKGILPQTPFSLLLTAERKKGFEPSEYKELDSKVYMTAAQFTSQLLETASHVQAPVTSLCGSFIHSLLIRETSPGTLLDKKDEDDNDMSDVEEKETNSESDSDMDVDGKQESVPKIDLGKAAKQKTANVKEEVLCEIPNLDWYYTKLK